MMATFKRLYVSAVLRNFLVLSVVFFYCGIFAITYMYRLPNIEKERILDNIEQAGNADVLNNPIFEHYSYVCIDLWDNGENPAFAGSFLSSADPERLAEYYRYRYFSSRYNAGFFNNLPEDGRYDHASSGGAYYSSKLVETTVPGVYRAHIIYTKDNAGFARRAMREFQRGGLIIALLLSLSGLAFAIWEVRPAKRAWKEQKDFFDNASHELRTPITVISSVAELIKKEAAGESGGSGSSGSSSESAHWVDVLSNEAENARRLVDALMFIARADARRIRIEKKIVRLDMLSLETYISMEALAVERGVSFSEFNSELPPELKPRCEEVLLRGDEDTLRRLISVLLKNAVENTDKGGTVSVSCYTEKNKAVLAVGDTGRGISKSESKKIFDRFYRASGARQSEGNSGIGLSVASWIVKKHNGSISVKSAVGEGSVFTVKLPMLKKPLWQRLAK
jgi:signal transduction histidine kinase